MRGRGPLVALLALVLALVALPASAAPQRLPDGAFLSAMTGGNTGPTAVIREREPRADGFRHIDTPATIKRLQQMHATMYTYGVWDKATDWQDLTDEFAPAAEAAGIDIMVYIVPPSECFLNPVRHLDGRCSRPFNMDYIRWAQEIARLSVAHQNVTSWGIDDFLVGSNAELFTKEYLGRVRAAQDAINPAVRREGAVGGGMSPCTSGTSRRRTWRRSPTISTASSTPTWGSRRTRSTRRGWSGD